MFVLIIFLIGIFADAAIALGDANAIPLPHCGVAVVQGAARDLGKKFTCAEIEERIFKLFPSAKLEALELFQLERVFQSFEFPTMSGRCSPQMIGTLPVPSVLYLPPTAIGLDDSKPGHFVLMRSIVDEKVFLEDLTLYEPNITMTVGEIEQVWDGHFLALASEPIRPELQAWIASTLMLCSAILLLLSLWFRQRRKGRSQKLVCVATIALGLVTQGCGPGSVPLNCDKPTIDLGEIPEGSGVVGEFWLQSWKESPVKILRVELSCDCMSGGDEFTGLTLAPNSRKMFHLQIPSRSGGSSTLGTAVFITDPPQSPPLQVEVRAVVKGTPKVLNNLPLRIEKSSGSGDYLGTAILSLSRTASSPALRIDREKSELGGLQITGEELSSHHVKDSHGRESGRFLDNMRINIASKNDQLTGKRGVMKLAFAGRDGAVTVPFVVSYSHPLMLDMDSVFIDNIKPGGQSVVNISFTNFADFNETEIVVLSSAKWLTGVVDVEKRCLLVVVDAPPAKQKLNEVLKIRGAINGQQLPEISLPVVVQFDNK